MAGERNFFELGRQLATIGLDFKEINPNGGYAIDIVPLNTGDEDLYITRNGDRRVLIGNSATVLGDSTNGTVLIVQNGNVGIGIGTITPTQKLDVNGYVKGRSGLCIGNDCRTSWPSGGIIPCSLSGSFVMGACASCGWSCAKFGSVPVLNCDGTKVTSITLKTCCVECDHADPGGYGH